MSLARRPRATSRLRATAAALLGLTVGTVSLGSVSLGSVSLGSAPAAAVTSKPRAWTDGPCAPDDNVGITVVVDFQELGGGVNVRCTGRAVTDGADALDAAGIAWQGVVRWGRGFVCKIAGKPAEDPCIDTPPASAYWSYWLAPRGGQWCYSNLGVLSRTPPPGSVEGWSFSLNHHNGKSPTPRYDPPPLAAGLTPNPLPGSHCDPGGGTVATAPTTTSLPTTTAPSTTAPVTQPSVAEPHPPSADGYTAPPPGTEPEGGSADPGADHDSLGEGSTGDTPHDDLTGDASNEDDAGNDGSEGVGQDEAAGANAVDLSVDGNEQRGLPLSTVVGGALVATMGLGALIAYRRRSRADLAAADTELDDVLGPLDSE